MLAQEHAPKWKPSGPTAATAMQVSLCPKQVVLADCIPTKETTLGSLNSLPQGRPQARPGPGGAGQQHLPPPRAPDLGEGQKAPGGPDMADEGPEPLSEEPLPEEATPTVQLTKPGVRLRRATGQEGGQVSGAASARTRAGPKLQAQGPGREEPQRELLGSPRGTQQNSHPLTQTQEHAEPHMAPEGAQRAGPTAT